MGNVRRPALVDRQVESETAGISGPRAVGPFVARIIYTVSVILGRIPFRKLVTVEEKRLGSHRAHGHLLDFDILGSGLCCRIGNIHVDLADGADQLEVDFRAGLVEDDIPVSAHERAVLAPDDSGKVFLLSHGPERLHELRQVHAVAEGYRIVKCVGHQDYPVRHRRRNQLEHLGRIIAAVVSGFAQRSGPVGTGELQHP